MPEVPLKDLDTDAKRGGDPDQHLSLDNGLIRQNVRWSDPAPSIVRRPSTQRIDGPFELLSLDDYLFFVLPNLPACDFCSFFLRLSRFAERSIGGHGLTTLDYLVVKFDDPVKHNQ